MLEPPESVHLPPSPLASPPRTFTSTASLETAVQAFNKDAASAIAEHGPIADWDVSAISNMNGLFSNLQHFNADISSWNTSGVTDMSDMFNVHPARALAPSFQSGSLSRACRLRHAGPHALPKPGPHLAPRRITSFRSAEREKVQQAAELRHVQRDGHGWHVLRALAPAPQPSVRPSPCVPRALAPPLPHPASRLAASSTSPRVACPPFGSAYRKRKGSTSR